jgi:hypothetical protein
MSDWLAVLESTGLAQALRQSVWVYPLVNAAHLLGVGLLLGSIIPLDLRLLGAWPSIPLLPLWRVLTRTAGAGLVLAAAFGSLLFIVAATEYAASGFFLAKMLLIGAASVNAIVLRAIGGDVALWTDGDHAKLPNRVRVAAMISLAAWLAALVLGRLVGYF